MADKADHDTTEKEGSSVETELTIGNLLRQKTRAKSVLTKNRNKLLNLTEDEDMDRKAIRTAIDLVCFLQKDAIDVIVALQSEYLKNGDTELAQRTKKELRQIEELTDEAVETAELVLRQTFSSDGSVSMKTHLPDKTNVPDKINPTKGVEAIGGKSETSSSLAKDDVDIGHDLWKQLKRVSIPIFCGEMATYQSWKAAFIACVDKAPATNVYKLLQLKQYLKGEPADLVNKLGHTSNAYAVAIERLDRKYGGARRQIALKLEEVTEFRPLRPGSAKDLEQFAELLDEAVICLRDANKSEELGDGCFYAILLRKLTESLITQYKRWVLEQQRQESVETLREWILIESELRTVASETKHGLCDKGKSVSSGKGTNSYFGKRLENTNNCPVCQDPDHQLRQCSLFRDLTVDERWEKVKSLWICFRCLEGEHMARNCDRNTRCGVQGCRATHHSLLHFVRNTNVDTPKRNPKVSPKTTMSTTLAKAEFIALRTIPVIVKNGNRRLKVNALLDDASTQTYINEAVASELGLKGDVKQVSVKVLNDKTESFDTTQVSFGLESLDGSLNSTIMAVTTTKVTGNLTAVDWQRQANRWSHLKDINFPKVSSKPIIDVLIGIDHLEFHTSRGDVSGLPGEPVARLTPLGWTCIGPLTGGSEIQETFFTCSTAGDAELNEIVQRFWEVDKSPDNDKATEAVDDVLIQKVKDSIGYDDERYSVELPWKDDPTTLPDNFAMAYRRLENVEKKLLKDNSLAQSYDNVIQQYIEKGYVKKVQTVDLSENQWFLPHFPVVKLDRETTKVRIVFDASASYKGKSLNDLIKPGPKLQNDLFQILLRFRRYRIGIICDIAEMYMQIEVAEKDRAYLRFLWRSMDAKVEPTVYEFTRVVFGLNCSPFLAQLISQENARLFVGDHEMAAEVVSKSTYMDDSMDSVQDERTAVELYEQLKTLWSLAGMHARKWISNSVAVLEHIPVADRLKEHEICDKELPLTKALGLLWNSQTDTFQFLFRFDDEELLTKRQFLRIVAKVFDPLGLIAPFVIRAKVLLQEMWIAGLTWDEELSFEIRVKAKQWISETSMLENLTFPRWIQFQESGSHLHIFVDASQEAYGAAAYVLTDGDEEVSSNLVAAKAHVAPVKTVSIPRMELLAAVLGVRLYISVARSLNIDTQDVVFWSDSLNVLWWVKSQSRLFKTFVANRIGYIQEHTNPDQWKYVPSKLNPADMLTRGVGIGALSQTFWVHGPDFLKSEADRPNQIVDFGTCQKLEVKKVSPSTSVCLMTESKVNNVWRLEPSRFSSLLTLCRVTAWVWRFLDNIRAPTKLRNYGPLTVEEIADAERQYFIGTQKEMFPEEYKALSEGKLLSSKSKLLSLHPYLDDDGVLRLGGRLKNATEMAFDSRCPVILPRRHWITTLVVKAHHEKTKHGGTNSTLASLSSRFWVIGGREVIREWERECSHCRRMKTRPASQLMADLPAVRVRCSMRAFSQVGIDFAGPFYTKQGRGKARLKRYLCLFTCLTTRAVHLELAFGLDTSAFLNAFFRMVHRRGLPKEVITDNGTNFVGAVRELRNLVAELNTDQLHDTLSIKGISWKFNPPLAPHFGGVFESLIKSAKKAIYVILSGADVSQH